MVITRLISHIYQKFWEHAYLELAAREWCVYAHCYHEVSYVSYHDIKSPGTEVAGALLQIEMTEIYGKWYFKSIWQKWSN